MLTVAEATAIVHRETRALGTGSVDLADAVGRILAEDIFADSDMPPFDRSQMDGYAVIAKDTFDTPKRLKLVGESAAGRGWDGRLNSGEAVRIMTGARIPNGADSVQKIELTSEDGGYVTLGGPTASGRFIVKRGSEAREGAKLISAGERISAKMIPALAGFGYPCVTVGARPRVSIIATGSEIIDISQRPGPDQIRNSNSPMLAAFAAQCGAMADTLPIAGDNLEHLKTRISEIVGGNASAESSAGNSAIPDILILTGGVSVGKYDLTKAALKGLGAEIFFERLRLKPGKPAVFARLNKTLIFGLPGNPVSAAVVFHLLVRKAILQMQGAIATDLRRGAAVLTADVKGTKGRDSYLPARLSTDSGGHLIAVPIPWHGSSDFVGFAGADALLIIPEGENRQAGEVSEIAFLA